MIFHFGLHEEAYRFVGTVVRTAALSPLSFSRSTSVHHHVYIYSVRLIVLEVSYYVTLSFTLSKMCRTWSFHIGVLQRMAKKYSKIYNAGVQIFKVLNLSSHDGDAEDSFDCKNMNIYFKHQSYEGSYLV